MKTLTVQAEMLQQLGGNRFLAFTGSKNLVSANVSEHVSAPYLQMDLTRNKANVNRLKITLAGDDTYTMKFYHQGFNKKFELVIKNEQTFERIYCDQLAEIFTQVTGLYTQFP